MVDVPTPANDEPAETSRDGLRRMQRLSEAARTRPNLSLAAFHPLTSALLYPSSSPRRRHVLTSVFTDMAPRVVPFPRLFSRAEMLSVSPDGAWTTVFFRSGPSDHIGVPHTRMDAGGGDIVVFSKTILEPSTSMGSGNFQQHININAPPLAVLHMYPPRTRLGSGGQRAAPALGPPPPPGHAAARIHGPTIIILTAELVYLLHPHMLPATVVLDTRSSSAVPTDSVSATQHGDAAPLSWTINTLRCPLGARAYADLTNPGPTSSPFRAQRGWLGMVPGNTGVWAAVERAGELSVLRIDLGTDSNNIPFLATTPLPALPRPQASPFTDSSSAPETYLEHVAFVPLQNQSVSAAANANGTTSSDGADPGVGIVTVYRDTDDAASLPLRQRTRFELCELRQRPVSVVDGFKEIKEPGSGDDVAAPLDWFPGTQRTTAVSPEGTVVLALTPLPDVPPYTLALALVLSPRGLSLTHVNLVPQTESDTSGAGAPRWPVLVGEEVALDARPGSAEFCLLPSQGARRGETGLVALYSDGKPRLVPAPRLGAGASPVETLKHTAERAARSVELAIVQGVDWSDAVRAAFAAVPRHDADDLAAAMLDQGLNLFIKHTRSYVPHILRLQVAVWAVTDDPRRALAAELIRLGEASQVFYLCGEERDGAISFDLDSVWNLVDVFEWCLGVLGATLRDAVAEKAHMEWAPSEPRTEGSSRLLYLVHPLLRRIIARLLALLATFAKFVTTLERPIRPPDTAFLLTRAPAATAVAATRVSDAISRQGIDLALWGDVLATLSRSPRPSDADTVASLLRLDLAPLAAHIPATLQALPAPSALFTAPPAEERDGASYELIAGRPTATCDRCAARTVMAMTNQMRGVTPGPWTAWRRNWVSSCVCGGTWMRSHLEPPPGLRPRKASVSLGAGVAGGMGVGMGGMGMGVGI